MNHAVKTGFSFGSTSGIITTLGLMVGLHSGTHSKLVVIGGILMIAIADAFSDALGIHISEESENKHTSKEIWQATLSTFIFKFIFASLFILPVLLAPLPTAIVLSIILGISLLSIFSYLLAKEQGVSPWKIMTEHILIAFVVIILTHYLGDWIRNTFGG